MRAAEFYSRFNFSKAEASSYSIVLLTALYVIGISLYPQPEEPSYTGTFEIVSKKFILEGNERNYGPYRRRARYGSFRPLSTYVPAHYQVYIQWDDDTYPIFVPQEKAYLLKQDKITFTYRITGDGRLRLLEFHDDNGHADSAEILDFGYFKFENRESVDSSILNFTSHTNQIPARKGIVFGFNFKLKGSDQSIYTELTEETLYPGLPDPDLQKLVYQDASPFTIKIGNNSSTCYLLENDWELVPGKWTFKIKDGDRLLAKKTFTLFKP